MVPSSIYTIIVEIVFLLSIFFKDSKKETITQITFPILIKHFANRYCAENYVRHFNDNFNYTKMKVI